MVRHEWSIERRAWLSDPVDRALLATAETGEAFEADQKRLKIQVPDAVRRNLTAGPIASVSIFLPDSGDQPILAELTVNVATGAGNTHPFKVFEVFTRVDAAWKKSFWVQFPGVDANRNPGPNQNPPATNLARPVTPLARAANQAAVADSYADFLSRTDVFTSTFDPNTSDFVMGLYTAGTIYRSTQFGSDATGILVSKPASTPVLTFQLVDKSTLILFSTQDQVTVRATSHCLNPTTLGFGLYLDSSKTYSSVVLSRVDMVLAVLPAGTNARISVDANWETTTGLAADVC